MNYRQWNWRWRSKIIVWNTSSEQYIDISGTGMWGRWKKRGRKEKEMMLWLNDRQLDWRWRSTINEKNAEKELIIKIIEFETWGRNNKDERQGEEMKIVWQTMILEMKEQNQYVKFLEWTIHWQHLIWVVWKILKKKKERSKNQGKT